MVSVQYLLERSLGKEAAISLAIIINHISSTGINESIDILSFSLHHRGIAFRRRTYNRKRQPLGFEYDD